VKAATPPTATLDAPPTSTHFADSQRLRAPGGSIANPLGPSSAANADAASIPAMNTGAMTTYPQMPGPYGFPPFQMPYFPGPFPFYPFYPHAPQTQDGGPSMYPMPGTTFGAAYGAGRPPDSAPPSPVKVQLTRPISLDEFCTKYGIDDYDKERLQKLRFVPGDQRVDKLGREDWHDDAGFSRLAWDDFLSKHKTFLRDVKAGCWV